MNKHAMKARIEALETEIGRILQMSPEVRAEYGFDWHLKCLTTELNALEAAEEAASQFARIGNGLYVRMAVLEWIAGRLP